MKSSEISEGMLQTVWLQSAVSALIDLDAQYIKRLFVTKNYAFDGKYTVRLNKTGMWDDIVVDDYIPCYNSGRPIFSRGSDESVWMLILEKAFAKLYGSYKNLEGGSPSEAFRDLTGCPVSVFSLRDEKVQDVKFKTELWKMLLNFQKTESLLTAVTETKGTWQRSKKQNSTFSGLTGPFNFGEAFCILKLVERNGIKLAKISNRSRSLNWNGDYSATSTLWTPDLRSFCEYPE